MAKLEAAIAARQQEEEEERLKREQRKERAARSQQKEKVGEASATAAVLRDVSLQPGARHHHLWVSTSQCVCPK